MALRYLACIVWLLSVAAAPQQARPQAPPPPGERILAVPLEEALAKARKVLQQRGLSIEAAPPGHPLRTTWVPTYVGMRNYVRYVVTGIRVDARRSIVRIFWVSSPLEGGGSAPANVMMTRDSELERLLAASLPSGAITEAAGGVIPLAPAPRPVRAPDFYLERWKEEGTGGLAHRGPCSRYVIGMRMMLQPLRVVLLGARPGSREVPEAIGDMVCEAGESALDVALGLPIPRTEQERIDRYVTSLGAPADQDALLRGDFWTGPAQDGRATWALVDLLDQVRAMRASGLSIAVVAYDTEGALGGERDARMAEVWRKRRTSGSQELFLVLADTAHARLSRAPDSVPMAMHLAKTEPLLQSFQADVLPAKPPREKCVPRWSSGMPCDLLSTPPESWPLSIQLYPELKEGFHGVLDVRRYTPSRPAVFEGHAPPTHIENLDRPLATRSWTVPGGEESTPDLRVTCSAYPTFAVVESDTSETVGADGLVVRMRGRGMKDSTLCARRFTGQTREVSLLRKAHYVTGVRGPFLFLHGGDSFGSLSDFAIIDARTGQQVFETVRIIDVPAKLVASGDRLSLELLVMLKSPCDPRTDTPACLQRMRQANGIPDGVPLTFEPTSCDAAADDVLQLGVAARVEDLDKPEVRFLGGRLTCSAQP